MDVQPLPPGAKLGFLADYVQNKSGAPLTIDSASIERGLGIGTTARIVQVKIAPITADRHAVPGSVYVTDPPVVLFGPGWRGAPGCHVQVLRPPAGYRVAPGARIRIWVVLQALRPGRYIVPAHVLDYAQRGTRYRQVVALSYHGSVSPHAGFPAVDLEKGCLDKTKLLNPKLRGVWQPSAALACGFADARGGCPGYLFRVSGMGAPMRSKACRCSLVGSVSMGMIAGVPAKRTWLRLRVARWASRPRKLW